MHISGIHFWNVNKLTLHSKDVHFNEIYLSSFRCISELKMFLPDNSGLLKLQGESKSAATYLAAGAA